MEIGPVVAAGIGAIGALGVAGIANIFGEDYKRFRDATALAGGLAGELASYAEAWPMLETIIAALTQRFDVGEPVVLPKIDKPVDRVYEAAVAKIGLLGPELAEDLAYVYNNINAFRIAFGQLSDEGLSLERKKATLRGAHEALTRATRRAPPLLGRLKRFALMRYRPGWQTRQRYR